MFSKISLLGKNLAELRTPNSDWTSKNPSTQQKSLPPLYGMAYYRRRRNHQWRSRRPVFGKKATRAIMAIAQKPVETKAWPYSVSWFNLLNSNGYVAGTDNWAVRSNIFSEIPRADSTLTKSEQEVIGNEIDARGFWIFLQLASAVAPGTGHYAFQFRLTVYSIADVNATAPTIETVPSSDIIYDADFFATQVTTQRFNTQAINVLKSHRWEARYDGNEDNFNMEHRMYVPITGRKIGRGEEGIVSSSTLGPLKGRNYYWLLEVYAPGASSLISTTQGSLNTKVYFKDA